MVLLSPKSQVNKFPPAPVKEKSAEGEKQRGCKVVLKEAMTGTEGTTITFTKAVSARLQLRESFTINITL